jgi:hypothetical protein
MSEHTPTPWAVRHFAGDHGRATIEQDRGEDNTQPFHPICEIYSLGTGGVPSPESAANAEFITRACNAHADLVEALRGLLAADLYADAEGLWSIEDSDTCSGEKAVRAAHTAIAKAKRTG